VAGLLYAATNQARFVAAKDGTICGHLPRCYLSAWPTNGRPPAAWSLILLTAPWIKAVSPSVTKAGVADITAATTPYLMVYLAPERCRWGIRHRQYKCCQAVSGLIALGYYGVVGMTMKTGFGVSAPSTGVYGFDSIYISTGSEGSSDSVTAFYGGSVMVLGCW